MPTTIQLNRDLSGLLNAIAETLDIPDELFEDAVRKYQDLGVFMHEHDDAQGRREPEVYAQGSFRLGTMIRAITDNDEYDIDLVYERDLQKESTTQHDLKVEAGANLRQYVRSKKTEDDAPELSEKQRCWRLQYPTPFHMDVLPAIPDPDGGPSSILITDKDLRLWQHSNPIGYAEWFKQRMLIRFMQKRAALAASIQASIEDVPEWRVKTPLQRAVQILKRHRDINFQQDEDDKPASIIITTLAGHAYENQDDLQEALVAIVDRMPKFIQRRDGVYWVPNPVNLEENFADRWAEHPQRATKFFNWLTRVRADLETAARGMSLDDVAAVLSPIFGESLLSEASARSGAIVAASSSSRELAVPKLADYRHCQAPQWPVRAYFKASVKGTVHKEPLQQRRLWNLTSRPVPKQFGLRFEVTTNVPQPYEVRWQVVNTGRAALDAGSLRGGFESGQSTDGRVRWESTLYRGTHWIEAFIIKDGTCVARSGRTYVRIA